MGQKMSPNWAVKRTPTLAMASPFSWPVLVPSAFSSGAAYLGLQGLPHLSSKSIPHQLPLAIDL